MKKMSEKEMKKVNGGVIEWVLAACMIGGYTCAYGSAYYLSKHFSRK